MTRKPIQRVNDRIEAAREYLREVGWVQSTHGVPGSPTDIRGALYHCDTRDGTEMIAARMLELDGFGMLWNDTICLNLFEALQAMDRTYTEQDVVDVYGKNWYGILGTFRLLNMLTQDQLLSLAGHIGPGDAACVLSQSERVGEHVAFEDAHLIAHAGVGLLDPRVWLLTDALIGSQIVWPDITSHIARILAPVAERLELDK